MELTSYERGLILGAMYAMRPWDSLDAERDPELIDRRTTQEEKDFCLYRCPFSENCMACESCDGRGNMKHKGRPKKNINVTEILILRKTSNVSAICRDLGLPRRTVYRAIRSAE